LLHEAEVTDWPDIKIRQVRTSSVYTKMNRKGSEADLKKIFATVDRIFRLKANAMGTHSLAGNVPLDVAKNNTPPQKRASECPQGQ
jgi:hypothetical protein